MTAITTVPNTPNANYLRSKGATEQEVRHQHVLSLIKNLHTRWFFFHKEGRTSKQLNHLSRAYNALCQHLPKQYDPLVEWKLAYENASRQFPGGIEYLPPHTAPDGFSAAKFRKGYVQPDMAPINEINWIDEDPDHYDGTDFLTDRDAGNPKTYDFEQVQEWFYRKRDEALEELLDTNTNRALRQLRNCAWLATLNLDLLFFRTKEAPWYKLKIDPAHMFHMEKFLNEETELSTAFIRDFIKMQEAAELLKVNLPFSQERRKVQRSQAYSQSLRKTLRAARGHFYDHSETLDDPEEMGAIKDPREVELIDYTPQSISQDLSLQLRHQGWTFNRKATAGVGTSDPIQMLFHMRTEVFYSFLRRRTHRFPKVKLSALMQPTAYKVDKDRKKRILPHHSIDNYIRSLAMCRWHDEAHGTSYFDAAARALENTVNFAPQVIELAKIACQALPGSVDEFNVRLFWKEDKFLKKHRYGYYHSKAQA